MMHRSTGLPPGSDPSGEKEAAVPGLSPPRPDERERDRELDEQWRLKMCAAEPIRTPGRIQSHGTVLGIDEPTQTVVYASENADRWLGRRVRDMGNDALTWTVLDGVAVDP